jgi:hypothetical protein
MIPIYKESPAFFVCHPLDEIERFSESVFRLFLETGFSFTTIPAFFKLLNEGCS